MSVKDIEDLAQKLKISLDFVLTALAVCYLEKYGKKGVNALIVRKGNDWVKKQAVVLGV